MAESVPDGPADSQALVLVTGLGPACAFGVGMDAFATPVWEGLAGLPSHDGDEAGPRQATLLRAPEFDLADYVESPPPCQDPRSRLGLAAAAAALKSAGIEGQVPAPSRSGLAAATVFGNTARQEVLEREMRDKGARLAQAMQLPHLGPDAANGLLCAQFGLRGHSQDFCGGPLCGSKAVQAGFHAVKGGLADLMLVGGCEGLTDGLASALSLEVPGGAGPDMGEAACYLVLESQDSIGGRSSGPICELAAFVSAETGPAETGIEGEEQEARIAGAISSAVEAALKAGGMWEGDVGAIFLATRCAEGDPLHRAAVRALAGFSQLPIVSACEMLGETFAAGFALECAAAVLVLSTGALPSAPRLETVRKGVEVWVEEEPRGLVSDAALVLDWSPTDVTAALLRAP